MARRRSWHDWRDGWRLPLRRRRGVAEVRRVRATGQVDTDFRNRTLGSYVVLCQPLPDLPRPHPDDGIFAQIDVRRPAEYLHRDGTLFERPSFAGQRFFAHVLQELLAPLAAVKHRTRQNLLELAANLVGIRRRPARRAQFVAIGSGFRHGTPGRPGTHLLIDSAPSGGKTQGCRRTRNGFPADGVRHRITR